MDIAAMLEREGWNVSKNQQHDKDNNGNKKSESEKFFESYLCGDNKYFLDKDKKQINSDFVDKYAVQLVKFFTTYENRNKNKISQIRGFYNTICKIDTKINGNFSDKTDFLEVKHKIVMLKSIVHNKKENNIVSGDFEKFIVKNVNAIEDKRDLKAFKIHFEAIMGYMPKDR